MYFFTIQSHNTYANATLPLCGSSSTFLISFRRTFVQLFFCVLVVNYFLCIEFLFIVSPFFGNANRISHLLGIKFPVLARLLLCGFLLVGNDLN